MERKPPLLAKHRRFLADVFKEHYACPDHAKTSTRFALQYRTLQDALRALDYTLGLDWGRDRHAWNARVWTDWLADRLLSHRNYMRIWMANRHSRLAQLTAHRKALIKHLNRKLGAPKARRKAKA